MSRSVEYLRIEIRNHIQKLRKKRKEKRKECAQKIGVIKRTKELRKAYVRTQVLPAFCGWVWCQEERGGMKAPGMAPPHREVLRRQLPSTAGKKPSVSPSLFLEINNLEG